jgi:hypothetical protein
MLRVLLRRRRIQSLPRVRIACALLLLLRLMWRNITVRSDQSGLRKPRCERLVVEYASIVSVSSCLSSVNLLTSLNIKTIIVIS